MRSILGRSRHPFVALPAAYLPPQEKSSKAVTLSALVHTPTAPAPEIWSSSRSMYCLPSRETRCLLANRRAACAIGWRYRRIDVFDGKRLPRVVW